MVVPSPTFDLETTLGAQENRTIAGVDEVGRGAWAGPVYAAAVILNPHTIPPGLRDSKTLSETRREALSALLWDCAQIGVGRAEVEEIDQIGVGKATYVAMQRAVFALPQKPAAAIIDGLHAPDLGEVEAHTLIKGDRHSLSVAAASIAAKVARDQLMRSLHLDFPHFSWDRNKGYGAKIHATALETHGVTDHHR
ncbi:MAG: ribonuclease HII, partial [Pseudomonadota bacterium]